MIESGYSLSPPTVRLLLQWLFESVESLSFGRCAPRRAWDSLSHILTRFRSLNSLTNPHTVMPVARHTVDGQTSDCKMKATHTSVAKGGALINFCAQSRWWMNFPEMRKSRKIKGERSFDFDAIQKRSKDDQTIDCHHTHIHPHKPLHTSSPLHNALQFSGSVKERWIQKKTRQQCVVEQIRLLDNESLEYLLTKFNHEVIRKVWYK